MQRLDRVAGLQQTQCSHGGIDTAGERHNGSGSHPAIIRRSIRQRGQRGPVPGSVARSFEVRQVRAGGRRVFQRVHAAPITGVETQDSGHLIRHQVAGRGAWQRRCHRADLE